MDEESKGKIDTRHRSGVVKKLRYFLTMARLCGTLNCTYNQAQLTNLTEDFMEYADSVQQVLLRKISKAEKDLLQLKLDYCRFVFGLTHRSRVKAEGHIYQVRSVDVESMTRQEDGAFTKPLLTGVLVDASSGAEAKALGTDWTLPNGPS